MQIRMICPAPPGTLYGNRITSLRWAHFLRELGHRLTIAERYEDELCDLLIALHARRSAEAVCRFRARSPEKPLIVALTGTDLYRDIRRSRAAQQTLEAADRLVALQPRALDELAPHLRPKLRVIYQSAPRTPAGAARSDRFFRVCVVGHLRAVKDPFRTALASRGLPSSSRIRVVHAGTAMTEEMARQARAEEARNPRYRWLGGIARWKVRRLIAGSRLVVLSSQMEGGANVISEAVVDSTPVLASRIPGSVGLLGEDYPGYFEFRNTAALRELLLRAESDPRFYAELRSRCAKLAPLFRPERERAAWKNLLQELTRRDGYNEPLRRSKWKTRDAAF